MCVCVRERERGNKIDIHTINHLLTVSVVQDDLVNSSRNQVESVGHCNSVSPQMYV